MSPASGGLALWPLSSKVQTYATIVFDDKKKKSKAGTWSTMRIDPTPQGWRLV
jgi:hypothetical protein